MEFLRSLFQRQEDNTVEEALESRNSFLKNPNEEDTDIWVFKWQEKAFSQHEDELYADINNCINPLHLRYHREILQQRSEGCRPNGRLFSYVNNDHHPLRTRDTVKYHTFASKYSHTVRRRHTKHAQGLPRSVICDPVQHHPSNEQRAVHRINTPSRQTMCLMADLRKQDGADQRDEHILCHITVDGHGRVTISPDFTEEKPAIRIENRHREVFEYRLENASEFISREEQLKEQKLQHELHARHADYMSSCVGDTFDSPPEDGAVRLCLHGEIVSGKGFEFNGLYVRGRLELPQGWWQEEGDKQSSSTLTFASQISRTKSKHLYNVAHFGSPFEFHLIHTPLEDEQLPQKPRILLEVNSLDYWDRHRVEGYGYLDLPSTPGSHELTVHTWRPAGRRLVDQLRHFFVGGANQINDLSYMACPRDFDGERLSRYGLQTESSGSVKLQLYVIKQSSLFVRKSQSTNPETLSNLQRTQATLTALVNAKRRAHKLTSSLGAHQ